MRYIPIVFYDFRPQKDMPFDTFPATSFSAWGSIWLIFDEMVLGVINLPNLHEYRRHQKAKM